MKKLFLFLLIGLFTIPFISQAETTFSNQDLQAVVRVDAFNDYDEYMDGDGYYTFGTGYFISYEGYLITAAHVVQYIDYDAMYEYMYDMDESIFDDFETYDEYMEYYENLMMMFAKPYDHYVIRISNSFSEKPEQIAEATLDFCDNEYDFAILRLNNPEGSFYHRFLRASSDQVKDMSPGEELYILGFPYAAGDNPTLTKGIFSGFEDEYNIIKSDISASGGVSGGPVLNKDKKILGEVTSKEMWGDITFATSYVGMEQGVSNYYETVGTPANCVYKEMVDAYYMDYLYYYDEHCVLPKVENTEYIIKKYYEEKCGQEINSQLLEDAAQFMASGTTYMDKWREYVGLICPDNKIEDMRLNYFIPDQEPNGFLVKSPDAETIYVVTPDYKKHVFGNNDIYNSWGIDSTTIELVSNEFLNSIHFGKNMSYQPGTLVKIETDPKTYLVNDNGVLRWIKNECVAEKIYGPSWNQIIKTIPITLFADYEFGDDIMFEECYEEPVYEDLPIEEDIDMEDIDFEDIDLDDYIMDDFDFEPVG